MRSALAALILALTSAASAQEARSHAPEDEEASAELREGDGSSFEMRAESADRMAESAPSDAPVGRRERITDRSFYDHRAPADHAAEDALLWIPRALLAPLWGLTVLRREGVRLLLEPVGPPPSTADAEESDQGPLGAMPVLLLENDRSPAAGLFVVLRPAEPLLLDMTVQHWDDQRIEGWLRARFALSDETILALVGEGASRGDAVFHGLGWDSRQGARTRYRHHRGGGRIALRHRFFRSSALSLGVRATHHRFGPSGFGGDPSLDAQVEPDAVPPAFASGATVLEERLSLAVDSRVHPRRAASEGLRLGVVAAHGADLEGEARWLRAAADLSATVALGPEHDLTVAGWAAAVEPLGASPPPFVEQVVLGGRPGRLAGYLRGRLIGRSAAVVGARYRWGIAANLDAALHVEAGNAFGPRFEDLRLERARLSVGVSVDSLTGDAHRVGILAAFATDPFERGGDVSAGHVSFFVGSPPQ